MQLHRLGVKLSKSSVDVCGKTIQIIRTLLSLRFFGLGFCFILCICTATAQTPDLPANDVFQLIPNDGTVVGRVVAVSDSAVGKRALVSRGGSSAVGSPSEAYVFRWNGTSWTQEQKLVASDGAYGDAFGAALAIDGNVAIVVAQGASTNNVLTGAIYIFRYNGSTWIQEQKLPVGRYASNIDDGYLGWGNKALSLSGNVIVVGSAKENSSQGAAYVYRYHPERVAGDRWVQEQKLVPPDSISGTRYFGMSAAVSGDRIVVGANGNSITGTFAGQAYVFHFDGSTWQVEQTLLAADGVANQHFGIAVTIDGTEIAVGARGSVVQLGGGWWGPAVYVFRFNGSTWAQEAKIPSDGYSVFGGEVALTGDTLLVKSCYAYKHYIYRKSGSVWNRAAETSNLTRNLKPLDPIAGSCLGSLSASGGLIALGGFDNYIQGGYVARSDIEPPHYIVATPSLVAAGSVTPRTVIVGNGKNKTFSFLANSGYFLHSLVIDSQRLAPVASYTLNNIRENHGVLAVFGQTSDVTAPTPSAPSYLLASGANSGSLSGNVVISSSPFDNVGISKIEFYAGPTSNPYAISLGTSYGSMGEWYDAFYSATWDTTTVSDGTYVLTAKAYDTAPTPNTGTAQRTVTVNNGEFLVTNGGNRSLTQGSSTIQTINVTRRFGTPLALYPFSVTGLPSGVSASFSPTSCSTTCSATMNLIASANAAPGTFLVSIRFYNVDSTFNLIVNKTSGDNTQYTLVTNSAGWSGTVTKSPAQLAYTSGTQVTLTANPIGGIFTGWTGCVTSTQNPVTITMDTNRTCIANFDYVVTPTTVITSSAGPNGQISPYGTIVSNTQRFQISPSSNFYRIEDVVVDGNSVGPVPFYDFTNVIGNHSIRATFAYYDFILSNAGAKSVPAGGSVTNVISATATAGTPPEVTFILSSNGGISASFGPASCAPGCSTTATITASSTLAPGIYPVTIIAAQRSTTFNLTVMPALVSSFPPDSYIDPQEDRDISGEILYGLQDLTVTFSASVGAQGGAALTGANFVVRCVKNGQEVTDPETGAVPTVASVTQLTSNKAGPYQLHLSQRICLGAWTEIKAIGVYSTSGNIAISSTDANRVAFGFCPMDITQDRRVSGDDVNRWLAIRNGSYPLPSGLTSLLLLDQRRNGVVSGEDMTRGIQLINGTGTYQPWRNFDLGGRP